MWHLSVLFCWKTWSRNEVAFEVCMVGSVLAGSGRREVAYNLCRVAAFIWGTEIVCEMGNHCTTPPLSLEGER